MTIDNATADRARPDASSPPRTRCARSLDRLPDTVTLEDIQYHLDVVVKVLEAEAQPASAARASLTKRSSAADSTNNGAHE